MIFKLVGFLFLIVQIFDPVYTFGNDIAKFHDCKLVLYNLPHNLVYETIPYLERSPYFVWNSKDFVSETNQANGCLSMVTRYAELIRIQNLERFKMIFLINLGGKMNTIVSMKSLEMHTVVLYNSAEELGT